MENIEARMTFLPPRDNSKVWRLRTIGKWPTKKSCPPKGTLVTGVVVMKSGEVQDTPLTAIVISNPTMLRYGADAGKWSVICMKQKDYRKVQQQNIRTIMEGNLF